ncbi:hypothetical protein ACIBUR_38735 [Streptomyces anulatus]
MVATVCSCGAEAEKPLGGTRPACTHDGQTRSNGGVVVGGYVVRPAAPGTCHTDRHTVHDVDRWEARNTVARCGDCVAADLGIPVGMLPWGKSSRKTADTVTPSEAGHAQMKRPARERSAAVGAKTSLTVPHGYIWADAREIRARDLAVGDVFVQPGTGTAYTTSKDGTVRGAGIAFGMELDGTAWTVVSRTSDTATCTSHTGRTLTDAPMPGTSRVLRVKEGREDTMDAAEAVARVKEIWAASQDEAPAPASAVLARMVEVISRVDTTMVMYEDGARGPVDRTVDDSTPLDEMGTDDLLTVLRENTADVPKGSLFADAWALLDRMLTDGGPECLPAPWDGPAEGTLIPHDADPETLINLNVRFTPQRPNDPEGDTHPCAQVGTAQIFTYRKDGRLIVGVETSGMDSTGESVETDADGNVPMTITVNGHVVFTE